MKEAFEKIKDFLKSKFDYCAEQAGMNLDAECGSEIASYFRERKELYLDRANIYGEVMREVDRIEAEYGNGWIPCSERLPEKSGRVLVSYESINDEIAVSETSYDYKRKTFWISPCVIAWMPLPSPYTPTTD